MAIVDRKYPQNAIKFDEALTATKFGKLNYILIFLTGISQYTVFLEALGISFVLPVSECDLNLSVHEKGVLSTISLFGIICSSHLWGFLADTIGRKRIIVPASSLAFIITVLSSFSPNYILLVILRFFNGVFISASSALAIPYLGEFHTNKNRNRIIMIACFMCSCLAILFPFFTWLVINQDWSFYIPYLDITYKPWRLYLVFNGLSGFFVALFLIKIPESPKFILSTGDTKKTLRVLKKIYSINTGKPEQEFPIIGILPDEDLMKINEIDDKLNKNSLIKILLSMWQQTQPLFSFEYLRRTILICFLQFSSFVSAQGMYMWFPEILNVVTKFTADYPMDQQNYTMCEIIEIEKKNIFDQTINDDQERICTEKLEILTYIHSTVFEILFVGFFIVMGSAMRIMGRTIVLFLIMFSCGACGVISVIVKIPLLGIYLFGAHLLAGLGCTVANTITVDLYPTNLRGMAMCISLMVGRIGCVVGSNVSGILLATNCQMAFFLSGFLLILCAFLVFLLPKTNISSKLKENEKEIHVIS